MYSLKTNKIRKKIKEMTCSEKLQNTKTNFIQIYLLI